MRRRERLRAQTADEIMSVALGLVAEGGPDAISLRAIGREMGMTAGAIYSYYPTRDDLVTALINDMYSSLMDTVEKARDEQRSDVPAAQILAWGEAFRAWALAHPEGFQLVYGDPIRGYQAPSGGAAPEAERRACTGLTAIVDTAWPLAAEQQSHGEHLWSDFEPGYADLIQSTFPDLPPDGAAFALRVWGRMHGLVALEVYGHLAGQTSDPGKLYRTELLDLIASMGLSAPDALSALLKRD